VDTAVTDGRFASASRATALEAQIAGTQGSNLLTKINTLETVTNNGTFATAGRATNLEAQMNRTQPSEMGRVLDVVDGRVTTVNTQLGARIKTVEDATTDGRFAAATRTTALEATVARSGNSVIPNDNFNSWPDGQSHPSNWVAWATNGNYRTNRLAPGRGGGQYCVQTLNDVADVDSGFFQTIHTAGAGKWVVEVTVNGDASGLRGAGVTLHGAWNLDFLSDPDTNGYRGDSTGEVRSWTKMFDIDGRDLINVHAMHGWSGFNRGMAAKYMVWHRLSLRPATAGEILAGKVDNDLNKPGGALARISGLETITTNGTFASAERANTLEAQVNGTAGSNLYSRAESRASVLADQALGTANIRMDRMVNEYNSIEGRVGTTIENRASAWARQEAGAVAQTVGQLRSEYNNARAELTTTSGVASDAYGRSRAFLQQTAVAGNGRAQLALYADSNGGGGVDIVGDVRISGNLVVDGTITSGKLAPSSVQQVAFQTLGYDMSVPRGGGAPGNPNPYDPGPGYDPDYPIP
jgi:cell wall assembly regulator SMI1